MTPSLSTQGSDLSPFALFMQADIVVQIIMVGLLLASIWVWAIIIGSGRRLARVARPRSRASACSIPHHERASRGLRSPVFAPRPASSPTPSRGDP